MSESERRQRAGLVAALAMITVVLGLAGLSCGSNGWSWPQGPHGDPAAWMIVSDIRAPRSLGAWLVGVLLGLSGALAQGLFRNPLADPYLLGSASGASLAVVVVLAAGLLSAGGGALDGLHLETAAAGGGAVTSAAVGGLGLAGAAFGGALIGMLLTLLLARGARHTPRLLLAGVVVGVLLTALNDLIVTLVPEALRGRQGFLLGSTGFLSWEAVAWLAPGAALALWGAHRMARALDALALGEDSASSLGLPLGQLRAALIAVLAWATGLAVAEAGLVAFVGLLAPHVARRCAPAPHRFSLPASAAVGGALLLGADVASRSLIAPQELPVGLVTAVLGGGYLLWLLGRRSGVSA